MEVLKIIVFTLYLTAPPHPGENEVEYFISIHPTKSLCMAKRSELIKYFRLPPAKASKLTCLEGTGA